MYSNLKIGFFKNIWFPIQDHKTPQKLIILKIATMIYEILNHIRYGTHYYIIV
jgi:hypothetical protein